MSAPASFAFERTAGGRSAARWWAAYAPALGGVLLLYLPTYRQTAVVFWGAQGSAHGPIVLAIWLALLWRARRVLSVPQHSRSASVAGAALIALGASLYAIGHSQGLLPLELASQLALYPGIVLALSGWTAARKLWFVWFFLLFLIPLPGSLIDSVLVPMKELTAAIVTQLLFHFGFPIARDGVVIYAGPYQLFIADACSGLNQLLALTAIGSVYVHIAAHRQDSRNLVLLASIVPVALLANLVRVIVLVLATYYGGDDLGRQVHDWAGYLEILLAFGAFFAIDRSMRRAVGRGGAA